MALVDKILEVVKEPIFWGIIVVGVIITVLLDVFTQTGLTLSILIGLVLVGIAYMIYNDMEQKKQIEYREQQKKESIRLQILEQREKDMGKGKCVSCMKPVSPDDKICPHCGFNLEKFKSKEINNL